MNPTRSKQLIQLSNRVFTGGQRLAQPEYLAKIQRFLLLLLLLWGVRSSVHMFWAIWPIPVIDAPNSVLINPVNSAAVAAPPEVIDVSSLLGLGLFGLPVPEAAVLASVALASNPREGLEQGARESSLDLTLTGIVASTEDGLGIAIIETNKLESNYAVGDALPISGSVKVAKVMPTQIVLDNNGTYELLRLFDKPIASISVTGGVVMDRNPSQVQSDTGVGQKSVTTPDNSAQIRIDTPESIDLALSYRQQLYDNPQSLSELVIVSAVRNEGGLRGYRVGPGRSPEQFRTLGFEAGDIVVAVNGMPLSDPANALRLYQTMRDATDATFDVERQGTSVSISVSLGSL